MAKFDNMVVKNNDFDSQLNDVVILNNKLADITAKQTMSVLEEEIEHQKAKIAAIDLEEWNREKERIDNEIEQLNQSYIEYRSTGTLPENFVKMPLFVSNDEQFEYEMTILKSSLDHSPFERETKKLKELLALQEKTIEQDVL